MQYTETLPLNERIAGVSRLWAEVKTHFANFELVPELDWDAVYLQTLERVKATPRTDQWAGKEVASLAGQAWVCWEKAPLDVHYVYEISITGGAQKYEKTISGPIGAREVGLGAEVDRLQQLAHAARVADARLGGRAAQQD